MRACPGDDGELPVFMRLHIGVRRVAVGRARRSVFQKLRALPGLPGLVGPGELLVQQRAGRLRVLLFEGQLQGVVGLQSRRAAIALSRECDGPVCSPCAETNRNESKDTREHPLHIRLHNLTTKTSRSETAHLYTHELKWRTL